VIYTCNLPCIQRARIGLRFGTQIPGTRIAAQRSRS